MNENTVPMLIIGLVVAFGTGYIVGSDDHSESPFPSNYDPAKAVESQGIKVAQETNKLCFDLISQQLQRQGEAPKTQDAH